MKMLFVYGMYFVSEQYNVKHYGKHDILLLEKKLLYLYLPTDWVGQYLYTYHNNVTHISSTLSHYV